MVMVRGAINFSYQVASFASRTASKNPSLCSAMPRRSLASMAARAQQPQSRGASQPTYGEVFNARGDLREQPITAEDAAMMRSVENARFGQTIKGGTAAKMQSAVDRASAAASATPASATDDVFATQVPAADFSGDDFYAAQQVPTLDEIATTDAFMDSVDIDVSTMGVPATGTVDVVDHPITIGEALEVAAENIGDKPITRPDAKVIQSAESRATGNATGVKRVVAAEAQSAADMNAAGSTTAIPTVKDVLDNAAAKMPIDKVVTHEDASRVQSVEKRNTGGLEPGGIAATLQSAADKNAASDFEPRYGSEGRIPNV
ncbi:late embryogenesis abundant protein D-34 [Selaginella moellendorffii]|uniref:late embryogenesis abundant protein D-34 n=1 Tax=Selaginella moellendorffii TaxID=88036 RepID=UPI000D1C8FC3|nr:late embryogenesis abundant protein D-34 [Selaginella moellendorffii]|eukprot:XP_024535242.1 late embryogenesis abundant protein D-34 [Selaginella moellendorffii]